MKHKKHLVSLGTLALALATSSSSLASSHREAPSISNDPAADNTDLYAWTCDQDGTMSLCIVANYIPLEEPAGGPNFAQFDDDVLYEIHVDNDGDALEDLTYQFRFKTGLRNPNTFLYNTGPIGSIDSTSWNRPQTYTVTRVDLHTDVSQVVVADGSALTIYSTTDGSYVASAANGGGAPVVAPSWAEDGIRFLEIGDTTRLKLVQPDAFQQ